MAAAPPTAAAPAPAPAPSIPARPHPSSTTAAGDSTAVTKAWVVTTAPPSAGPREAVLLRRLKGVDRRIEAVEVQEFYFLRTREGIGEDGDGSGGTGSGSLAEGVMGVLREAAAAGATAQPAVPAGGAAGHYYHWRAYAPRPAFRSVWSSNVRSILTARGLLADEEDPRLPTLEAGRWYRVRTAAGAPLGAEAEALLHDRMTECAFLPLLPPAAATGEPAAEPVIWGAVGATALPTPLPAGMLLDAAAQTGTATLPLRARGPVVLEEASAQYGLGLGPWEIEFLTELFWDPAHGIERDPTAVEIFDVAQSLSEHCRHWTFDGRFVIDGAERRESLMEMVKAPLRRLRAAQEEGRDRGDNSVLAFEDNSSAIRGPARVLDFQPARPDGPSPYVRVEARAQGLFIYKYVPMSPTLPDRF